MTRTEIEDRVLALPTGERVAVAEAILTSLSAARREAFRERLAPPTGEDLEALSAELAAKLDAAFSSGEGRVWTEADWDALKRGEYRHAPDPDSWAIPPSANRSSAVQYL